MSQSIPKRILPVIVFAQFAGTSLWFAGNAVIPDLVQELQLTEMVVGYITSSVQLGFICGTLLFAFLSVADRISPAKVFLSCAVLGASANAFTPLSNTFAVLLFTRFATGFFLAGIYPVGMKIASDWHKEGLGKALGYLVGALVLGKAFPFLLNYISGNFPWRTILYATSLFATVGGVLLYYAVPDGPYQTQKGEFKPGAIFQLFKDSNFRSAAFGYFGHMWELYTFWAFIPIMIAHFLKNQPSYDVNISLLTFMIIGIGGISCAMGGYVSLKKGSKTVAGASLAVSGICSLLIPFFFGFSIYLFLFLLILWGIAVIPDSPQFSALVAKSADRSYVATGLTIVNSIGFALTIVSIQLVSSLWSIFESPYIFWVLAAGPVFGFLSISRYRN